MIPKEKAEELKEMFDGYTHYAEKAVDEILKSYKTKDLIYPKEVIYWQEVKQEIEKL